MGIFAMLEDRQAAESWRNVYLGYRARIDRGELRPGDALPTLAKLAAQHGLTPHGARRVMARLRDEGRVESWQGVGHRVSEARVVYRLDNRPRFTANLARLGQQGDTRLLSSRTIGLPARFAEAMGLRPGIRVIRTEVLRFAEGRPIVLACNYFPADRFEGIECRVAETQSITEALASFGIVGTERERTSIESRMPSAHEALQLDMPTNQPVLVTTGRNIDRSGTVVELSYSVSRGDVVTIEV